MDYPKPTRSQVNTVEGRQLLISFVPEEISSTSHPTTQQWAKCFERHLNAKKPMVARVIDNQAGTHTDQTSTIRDKWTDFVVVYTVDYALSPPAELHNVIDQLKQVGEQVSPILMWIAQYDADNYQDSELGKTINGWHVLTGKGKGGARFRKPFEDPAWEDDLTDAAAIIHSHASCEQKSTICPKQQAVSITGNDNQQRNPKSFITRVFDRIRGAD